VNGHAISGVIVPCGDPVAVWHTGAARRRIRQSDCHKVSEGMYLFTATSYGDVGMCGNSIAILTEEGVLVFDSAALPETASIILKEIRRLTRNPVRYLINSHWHWDHWGGNQVFKAAFPDIHAICM